MRNLFFGLIISLSAITSLASERLIGKDDELSFSWREIEIKSSATGTTAKVSLDISLCSQTAGDPGTMQLIGLFNLGPFQISSDKSGKTEIRQNTPPIKADQLEALRQKLTAQSKSELVGVCFTLIDTDQGKVLAKNSSGFPPLNQMPEPSKNKIQNKVVLNSTLGIRTRVLLEIKRECLTEECRSF